ncbi:tetratricopeptide repeat protein [Marimonas sp. MJW-29]|uniref:Tetratricopeptide repeat protein n=1 Tax=Sulfitobacter sediminis TaxID=3234186 RepID=A0ABV3RU75_9RHOB
MLKNSWIAIFALKLMLAAPSEAQEPVLDYSASLAAYNAGDYRTALNNWHSLAEQGHPASQCSLGYAYEHGFGVPQDYSEAIRWYKAAADKGDARAQAFLGQMYEKGLGAPQDYMEAIRWYTVAAKQSHGWSQSKLGEIYRRGQGVPKDFVSAHMWFNIASAVGDPMASFRRAELKKSMTLVQVAEAKARARVCMSSGYDDCKKPHLRSR